MGFSQSKLGAGQEGDVIIGLIDTGAWPEHPSFNDTGYSPPPAKWKGACETTNFTCNNKLIGGRFYNSDGHYYGNMIPSPRDTEGHGTHTATTAGGGEVVGASYLGLAEGVARGGVSNARVAVYKVCGFLICLSVDILKAFDDAIADGVDIISVSLGSFHASDYIYDPIAIGSFHAMKRGVLTSASAGNSGPDPVSVCNVAPWLLSVAASTIDRKFVANLVLGNGLILRGNSINTFDLNGTSFPLIWGGDAVNYTAGSSSDYAIDCGYDDLNLEMVVGKIVVCQSTLGMLAIREVNGIGIILIGTDAVNPEYALSYQLPVTMITPDDGRKVLEYIRSTRYPTATILVGESWKDAMAPRVASFSSRGPNAISPDILKPDITAPGVNILAGWSPMAPPSFEVGDTRVVYFNIASGTSMSCPHASGAAAYVKAAHPQWSPAAIKSAIMTTAHVMDPRKHSDMEFAYGSGHINPAAAIDPGLVFDASVADYVDFLCKQGYNTTTLRLVAGDNSACANTAAPGRGWDLNYPSLALYVEDGQQISGSFARRVTNVGKANSTYTAAVDAPPLINVTVDPAVLTFSSAGETQQFAVHVAGPAIKQVPIISAAVTWSDGSGHSVRTPVVVYNYSPGAPYNLQSPNSNSKMI
ncbi:subtilisin-like protease SBT4.3 [Salvia miltiorrhiza]|uniref:subtilisin-like protease SBT4.3 n=1 Tax=Salvia miltiorrhiza TaxID=226208 RepID=UPI0025AD86F6|nr:subtilisin-like protease SBT4.3 [Salvia miltiorrhiza]